MKIRDASKPDRSKYLFDNATLFALILPLIIEQTLSLVVGLADSIMVASVGEAAVSAVSLIDNIMVLIVCVFSALATGGAVIAGQYLGQQNEKSAKKSANELVWFTGLMSIVIMIIIYIGKYFILNVVFGKISPEVYAHADTYLMIVTASVPFIAIYSAGAAIFRTMGNSKVTMNISLIMNLINVTGNAICIYGFKMGAEGVAIPTLISRMVAAFMIMGLLFNKSRELCIEKTFKHKFDWSIVKKILGIGVPNGLENGMFQLGKILLLSLVSGFGTASITANAIAGVIASLQVMAGSAISLAVTTVISRCIGANDYEQAKYYTKKLILITYIAMFVINIAIFIFLDPILGLYQLSGKTMQMTKEIIIWHTVGCMLIWPFAFDLPATLRAAGDVKYTMIMSIVSMWTFRLMFGYLLGEVLGFGVLGIWIAMMIDWVFRCIVFIGRFIGGKWKNFKSI